MGNTLQIVDSVASSPTVLLDLNNENPYGAYLIDLPPPPLRRTTSSSMLVDGDRISSSAYGNRTLNIGLDLISTSQDNWATAWQTLARQIDRDTFFIKYQPTGATSPVFFKCYRTDVPSLEDITAAIAYRRPSLQIPADPFAYGLAEDIASFTITNNPSSGTNRMMYTLPTIKGDVETPLMLAQTSGPGVSFANQNSPAYLASYSLSGGNTHSFLARDLSELTAGTDVAATVTGAGTNYIDGNYRSCSFATPAMNIRLLGSFSTALTPMPGQYRVLLRVVSPAGAAADTYMSFKLGVAATTTGGSITYSDTVTRFINAGGGTDLAYLIDLGVLQLPVNTEVAPVGLGAAATTTRAPYFSLQASAAVTSALRFDEMFLIPTETNYGTAALAAVQTPSWAAASAHNVVAYDASQDAMRTLYDSSGTAPFSGLPVSSVSMRFVGGLPVVRPGNNNYLQWIFSERDTTLTTAFTGRYYPRYLYVRPATT